MDLAASLAGALPELTLVIGAMALLIAGVFLGDGSGRQIAYGSILLLIVALILTVMGPPGEQQLFGGSFRIDQFAVFSKVLIFAAAAIAIIMSLEFIDRAKSGGPEYSVLIVLAAFGMALMVSANDLIALYMGVETQSLALYILASFNRDSQRSTEAGLKYFVLGALSSCLLLYGATLVYGFTGATGFAEIAAAAAAEDENLGLVIGLVFVICGLAFKISAAPFHMWTPDVYEGAPTPVTAFFAGAPKLAGMALFMRALIAGAPGVVDDWRPIIAMIAIASMAIGAFSAIAQTNIKRLLAYSSIGHMGYALVGLSAGTTQGVSAVLIYMAIYLPMTIGAFACVLLMRRRGGVTEEISDLAGLTQNNMPLAIAWTILLFSLAGIPPLAGFFAKWYVFLAAVEADLVWLAVVGVLASAVSAFYYLRIIWFMWFDEPAQTFERGGAAALRAIAWTTAALMFPVLTIFIGQLRQSAQNAAAALF